MNRTPRVPGLAAAATLVLALTVAGCTGGTDGSGTGQDGAARSPSGGASDGATATGGATASDGATPAAATPVLPEDFPDPDVVDAGDTWYAYATQRPGNRNLQMARSTDLETWEVVDTDPLPTLPDWAAPGRTWAPEVTRVGSGYVMYFTARNNDPDLQCIGVARSTAPTGPFTPVGDRPLVCPEDLGGAIDAASHVEPDGSRWLLWKNDGNCCGKDTWLHLQRLSADGLELTGSPRKLIKQDQPWEGDLVEAPTLVRRDEGYTLFYSANSYGGDKYATGYATADRLQGPYTKATEPLLTTQGTGLTGPGGQDVVDTPDGDSYLFVHAWDPAVIKREMYRLPLTWQGDVPVVTTAGS